MHRWPSVYSSEVVPETMHKPCHKELSTGWTDAGKTRRRFNRWLRKFSAELQTLLLIQISKTKAINAQFGPFSRDNLTPQTLILSARKLLHTHRQIKIQVRFETQKPNVWATLSMNLEIETLSSIGRDSKGMKTQHWSYHPCRDDISYLAWISFSKCDLLPCYATNMMQCQCKA